MELAFELNNSELCKQLRKWPLSRMVRNPIFSMDFIVNHVANAMVLQETHSYITQNSTLATYRIDIFQVAKRKHC